MAEWIVLCGHTASGKTTVANILKQRIPNCTKTTSYTTREPRADEEDGRDYHFITEQAFEGMRDAGELLEWTEYKGHFYGTGRDEVINLLNQGRNIIMVMDLAGAKHIEQAYDFAKVYYLQRDYVATVKSLNERASSQQEREARVCGLKAEIAEGACMRNIIQNDSLEETVQEILTGTPRIPLLL